MMISINIIMIIFFVGFVGVDFLDYQEFVILLVFFDFLSFVVDVFSQVGENCFIGLIDVGMVILFIQENVDYVLVVESDYLDDEEVDDEVEINIVLMICL